MKRRIIQGRQNKSRPGCSRQLLQKGLKVVGTVFAALVVVNSALCLTFYHCIITDSNNLKSASNLDSSALLPVTASSDVIRKRLCTSEEIKYGSWKPIMLDQPPHVPRQSKCWSKEELINAKNWPYFHWHPTQFELGNCDFQQWDADLFCNLARNKTVGIMGDSLSWEHFASLVGLLGIHVGAHDQLSFVGDNGQHYSQQNPFTMNICNHTAKAAFYRNRYLMYPGWFLNETRPDIMVFNRGAHWPGLDKELMNGYPQKPGESGMVNLIKDLHRYQGQCRKEGRDCLSIWRTSPPGHPWCQNFTHPATSLKQMEDYIAYDPMTYLDHMKKFMWWEFKTLNKVILEEFQKSHEPKFQFDIIPGYEVNILRPDGHVSADDCLHNCDPGVADVYNTLLLHLMRLHHAKNRRHQIP